MSRIAIIGRPNVGKSTLFNKLAGRAAAMTSPIPGTTRDILETPVDVEDGSLTVADSAGWGTRGTLGKRQDAVLSRYLGGADAALLVVSADVLPQADDFALAAMLRTKGIRTLVVCNKADTAEDEPGAFEYARLGLGVPLPVSAILGRRIAELRARLGSLRDGASEPALAAPAGRGVLLGQPNVGKSSLFNALLEEERSLVHDEPGTTRDPVEGRTELGGAAWRLIDTAGVSRRGKFDVGLSKESQDRSLRMLAGTDVVVLVLDLSEPMARQDLRLADEAVNAGAALAVALNKVDLLAEKKRKSLLPEAVKFLHERFPTVGKFPVLLTSAVKGDGVAALRETMAALGRLRHFRASPDALADEAFDWPSAGKPWNVRQTAVNPPTFHVRTPPGTTLGPRFVSNRLREALGLHGVPILIRWSKK